MNARYVAILSELFTATTFRCVYHDCSLYNDIMHAKFTINRTLIPQDPETNDMCLLFLKFGRCRFSKNARGLIGSHHYQVKIKPSYNRWVLYAIHWGTLTLTLLILSIILNLIHPRWIASCIYCHSTGHKDLSKEGVRSVPILGGACIASGIPHRSIVRGTRQWNLVQLLAGIWK